MSRTEPKKAYTFRFNKHTNAQLSNLAAHFHMDRTEVIEYMIGVWAQMWVENNENVNE